MELWEDFLSQINADAIVSKDGYDELLKEYTQWLEEQGYLI